MTLLAGIIVAAFAAFMIGVAAAEFVRPALVERFLRLFASSARAHYTEQTLRLLLGVSVILLASATWHPVLFRAAGWTIVAGTVPLLVLPWRWHWRFGTWVMPTLLRYLKLYAVGLLVFGLLLLSGVFSAAGT